MQNMSLGGWLLAFTAFAAPTMGAFGSKGFAPLLMVLAGAGAIDALRRRAWPQTLPGTMLALLGAFIVWALLSGLWALDSLQAVKKAGQLLGVIVSGLILTAAARRLDPAERRAAGLALQGGLVLGLILVGIEAFSKGMLSHLINPGGKWSPSSLHTAMTVSAILAWPAAASSWRNGHRAWAALLLAGVAGLSWAVTSLGGVLALAVGGLLFLGGWLSSRATASALAACVALFVLAAPWAGRMLPTPAETVAWMPSFPSSSQHRLLIWKFVSDNVAEKPLFGWGMDASRNFPGNQDLQPVFLFRGEGKPFTPFPQTLLPLHPHNFALQVWLETGLVGAVLVSGFLGSVILGVARLPTIAGRAAALAAIGGALSVGAVSFGAWQSWWLALLWLLAALLGAMYGKAEEDGAS